METARVSGGSEKSYYPIWCTIPEYLV
jgi:hypothetical protein